MIAQRTFWAISGCRGFVPSGTKVDPTVIVLMSTLEPTQT